MTLDNDMKELKAQAGADLRDPLPWVRMGESYEAAEDPRSAAYCYYLSIEIERNKPALAALRRLGYL